VNNAGCCPEVILSSVSLISFFTSIAVIYNIGFKTPRIEAEFNELEIKNKRLYYIIKDTNNYTVKKYKKNITLTEVYRTQEEQNRYYKGKPKFKSPHQRWLAVDIRTHNFTKQQVQNIVKYINNKYNKHSRYIPTAFYHDIGLGPHIHVQFKERQ
jgi:DNA polymerase II small subunit/DNA polymerase delta subunit B